MQLEALRWQFMVTGIVALLMVACTVCAVRGKPKVE